MKKINFNYTCWALAFTLFALFILVFSYLYPYGADEYFYQFRCPDLIAAVKEYFFSYTNHNPRIGLLVNNIIISNGKWLFLILNPLIQLFLVLSLIRLINGKWVDFSCLKDFPLFVLLAAMSVFLVVQPDNTLFWIGGACNYSWSFLPFIWLLIFLRHIYENGQTPNLKIWQSVLLFIGAFILGMSNENNSIAAFMLILAFMLYCFRKRIKICPSLAIIFLGVLIGLVLLFAAPGSYKRAAYPLLSFFREASILEKITWHYPKIQDLAVSMFLIPPTALFFMLLELFSTRLKALRNNDFLYSAITFLTGMFLAAILAGAPILGNTRPFYSASAMWIISFVFLIKYFQGIYKFDLMRIFAWAAFIFAFFITPFFSIQYFYIYSQEKSRGKYIEKLRAKNPPTAYIPYLLPIDGPTNNLRIFYYDVLLSKEKEKLLGLNKIVILNKDDNQLNII